MLNTTLDYLANYFTEPNRKFYNYQTYLTTTQRYIYEYPIQATFTATDTISGDFEDTFLVGEYIKIEGSRLNDGVFKIAAIDNTTLTIDTNFDQLIKTETEISVAMIKCFIPESLTDLIAEIKTYTDSHTVDGVKSESIDDYSITYTDEAGKSGWQGVFKGRLAQYKRVRWGH